MPARAKSVTQPPTKQRSGKSADKDKVPALPKGAGNVIADAKNDITIPFFTDVLQPVDDTLAKRGGGKGVALYDEIERDTHAAAVLNKRKGGLVAREWTVEPGGDDDRDQEAADLVEGVLQNIPFDRICEDLLDATLKGFAVSEIVWGLVDGKWQPTEIISHDQRRFVFDLEWRPRMLTKTNRTKGIELPERKFIVHRHGVKGNNPYGLGLGSRLFWPVLFKREGVTFWLTFLEKYASPTVIGKSPYGLGDAESNKLLNALESIVQSAAVTVPVGTEVSFLEASRSGNVSYESWVKYWDGQMSISTLGETLTTDIGDNGSRAAAETHADVLQNLIDADADLLSDTLRTTLLQWIVDFNLPGAKAPKVWRARAANELEQAELREKQGIATLKHSEALMDLVVKAACFDNDDDAKRFVISLMQGAVSDDVLETLIPKRFELADRQAKKKELIPATPAPVQSDRNGPEFAEPIKDAEVVEALVDQLLDVTAPLQKRRIDDVRAAAMAASSLDDLSVQLLELQTDWSAPDQVEQLQGPVSQALTLSAFHGHAAVMDEVRADEAEADFADGRDADGYAFITKPFQEQLDYFNGKKVKPSKTWLDIIGRDHDRAFIIAGATDKAMLGDFQKAIGTAIKDGLPLEEFQKDFDSIVKKYGWEHRGDAAWRAKVIFETNVRTSHMAGRLKQMRDPAVLKARPFWQYVHGQIRKPISPRANHKAWDGLILKADDPWWEKHFPPNGFKCSCGVRTLSQRDLEKRGKSGPDDAPNLGEDVHQRRGGFVKTPSGVDVGWDHQPGSLWVEGLTPRQVEALPSVPAVRVDAAEPIAELIAKAPPLKAKPLVSGKSEEFYVEKFLKAFGAKPGQSVLFEDKAGEKIIISDRLFVGEDGRFKVLKRGREIHVAQLAEAIIDPDEIWVGVAERSIPADQGGGKERVLDRKYIRVDPKTGLLAIFELQGSQWTGKTAFSPLRKNSVKTDINQIDRRRTGKLVYKRDVE